MNHVSKVQHLLSKIGKGVWEKTGRRQWLITIVVFMAITGMLLAGTFSQSEDLAVGKVATRDIAAPFRVENAYLTEQAQDRAARQAELDAIASDAYYTIRPAAGEQAEERVAAIFSMVAAARSDYGAFSELTESQRFALGERLADQIETERGLSVPASTFGAALSLPTDALAQAEQAATSLAADIMAVERVSVERISTIRRQVIERVGEMDVPPTVGLVASGVVQSVITPNLMLNNDLVEQARRRAKEQVEPIYVEQGQIIVRWGDVIDAEQMAILQDVGFLKPQSDYRVVIGLLMIIALVMALMGTYLYQHESEVLQNQRHFMLLGLIVVATVGLAKLASVIPAAGIGYLIPVALATMLLTTLLNSRIALTSSVVLAVIVGLIMGDDALPHVIVALTSGMVGVFSVGRISQRGELTRAGLIVGATTFGTMLALGLLYSDVWLVKYSFIGVFNGLLSAIGTIGLLPYVETVFGITSSIRLLELSNPNHPLLRQLLLEAPGTYHHSMMVGNLAEAAAEAIGGDPLLTRVGSQYHDIGKIKRPYFFGENQFSGVNPHDKISPTLSTLIITSHVKDGVELAHKYKLPDVLVRFIREHHGSDLVKYFYHRAVESGAEVEESEFRYPGPKPQSKETAIVMLADSVEAAVRAMPKATPGRIEGLIRKIIKDRLGDGQLDESNITLRDLDQIADAFVKVFMGMFHQRVEYPALAGKEAAKEAAKSGAAGQTTNGQSKRGGNGKHANDGKHHVKNSNGGNTETGHGADKGGADASAPSGPPRPEPTGPLA